MEQQSVEGAADYREVVDSARQIPVDAHLFRQLSNPNIGFALAKFLLKQPEEDSWLQLE